MQTISQLAQQEGVTTEAFMKELLLSMIDPYWSIAQQTGMTYADACKHVRETAASISKG